MKESTRASTKRGYVLVWKDGRSLANQPAAKGNARTPPPPPNPSWEMPLFGNGVNYSAGRGGMLSAPGQGSLRATRGEEAIHFGCPCLQREAAAINPLRLGHRVPCAPFSRRPLSFGHVQPPEAAATGGALIPAAAPRSAAKPRGRSALRRRDGFGGSCPVPQPRVPRGAGLPPTAPGCSTGPGHVCSATFDSLPRLGPLVPEQGPSCPWALPAAPAQAAASSSSSSSPCRTTVRKSMIGKAQPPAIGLGIRRAITSQFIES